jgi:hypothetical protein
MFIVGQKNLAQDISKQKKTLTMDEESQVV